MNNRKESFSKYIIGAKLMVKNASIAEFAKIRVGLLSGILTAMLLVDALAITLTVAILDSQTLEQKNILITLFVVAAASGVILYSLAKRYIGSITYRFESIEDAKMSAISNIAKRFYLPFMVCLVTNIFLALSGSILLAIMIFS